MAIRLDSSTGNNVAKHIGHRGYCYRSLGRLQEALKDYNEAIRISQSENAQYYYERALVGNGFFVGVLLLAGFTLSSILVVRSFNGSSPPRTTLYLMYLE